ncbi:MAG: methionine--tRNA ligase [Solirubrobacterales bacterium]
MGFYVTTPIYYVNAQPHLGHAYTTIAADVLARHMRQRGEDVFFLTGTDEHGEPVADVAEREGVPPRELADRNVVHFKEMARRVNASIDFFIRTSDPEHGAAVQRFMQALYDRGHIYPGTYEGWYCPRCADFKTEQEIVDGSKCPIHRIELNWEKEDNYFFRLSSFQEPLERLYAERRDFVMPGTRYNEAVGFIRQGLEDVSCTRARLRWGVKAPWDESQVFYVWFDALLNYLTALAYAREGEDLTDRYWPADFHLIGKDILKFHAVIWPAMLIAAGVEVPRHLFIHGFLLMEGEKMSKSLGNVLDPFQVMDVFGTDALRYYCLREVSFGQDGSVSTAGFEARYNTELANEYGNLASRTLAMIGRYRDGFVPPAPASSELTSDFDGLAETVRDRFDRAELTAALEVIWSRGVRRLNRYVEEQAPWALAKEDGDATRLDEVLYGLAEGLRVVSVLLHAYMPETTTRLLDALGQDDLSLERAAFGAVPGGATVGKLPPLFPKIEAGAPAHTQS